MLFPLKLVEIAFVFEALNDELEAVNFVLLVLDLLFDGFHLILHLLKLLALTAKDDELRGPCKQWCIGVADRELIGSRVNEGLSNALDGLKVLSKYTLSDGHAHNVLHLVN